MSDTPNEFETVDDNEQEPGKLRQLLKQAHATLKQKDKELLELLSEKAATVAKTTWDELKVPAPIRDFYKGEQTPDAMKQWWEASKGFFNIEAGEEAPVTEQPSEQELAQQQAAQQFQDASSLGTNAIHSGFDAIKAQVEQAKGLRGADYDAAKAKIYEAMGTPKF